MKYNYLTFAALAVTLLSAVFAYPGAGRAETCKSTAPDALGPMYKPDAPVRSNVGTGYVLTGMVKSSRDCAPIKGAKVEFWLAGPDKEYDDKHRATLFSEASGAYRFESNSPPGYSGRPPHIHVRVSVAGFGTLVAQHYPQSGKTEAIFDLVLIPEQ
jgi:protocatechuate 3,4-dioxygenase beta subunit